MMDTQPQHPMRLQVDTDVWLPGHVRTGMPAPPRSWRRALNSLFADYRPVSSHQAAEAILTGVSHGDWRVIIGQDAQAIDARVRTDPGTVYD